MNTATVEIEQLPGRLRSRIEVTKGTDPCWRWTGVHSPKGYALIGNKPQKRVHRLVYEALVSPIPARFEVHHRPTCPKDCVNPMHVQPIPKETHTWLHSNEAKTHCSAGHELTVENRIRRTDAGTFRCKQCEQARWREAKRKKTRIEKLSHPVATLEMM